MINTDNLWNLKYSNESDSIFNDYYETNEPVNTKEIFRYLKSGLNHYYADDEKQETAWLQKVNCPSVVSHLKKIMKNVKDGQINTSLKNNNPNGIGRASYKNFCSISSLPREIRQFLSLDLYVDYDLDNAHFSILYNICKKQKIPEYKYKNLSNLVNNREEILKKCVIEHYYDGDATKYNLNGKAKEYRSKCKTLLIIVQFLGSYDKWRETNEIGEYNIDPFVPQLKNEIQNLIKEYMIPNNQPLYKRLKQDISKAKKKAKKAGKEYYKNVDGALSSRFTQHYERIIIESVLVKLRDMKLLNNNRFVYMFDGFQLTLSDSKNISCKDLVKWTQQLTGFKLQWSIKEMDEGIAFRDKLDLTLKNREQELIHPKKYCDEFNGNYFKSIKGNYALMKDYFQLFICFVELPEPLFWKIENIIEIDHSTDNANFQKKIHHLSKSQLKEIYGRYGSGSFTQSGKEVKFLELWLDDEDLRTYKCLDFYPRNCKFDELKTNNHYLNTFCGYPDFLFEKNELASQLTEEQVIKPFQDILVNVLGGDRMDMEHFEMLMAYKIKYPSKKQPYTIVIMGLEGEGKNVCLDIYGNIVGQEHYITTSKIGDICDTHAEGLYHKLIANMNEMGFGDSEKYANVLKSLCSENTMIINPKNVRPFKIHNHALLVITSNENLPIKLDIMNSDRRNCIFKGNGKNIHKYKGKGVWKSLVEYFKKDMFLKVYYEYLMALPVDDYDFKLAKRNNEKKPAYNSVAQYFYPSELLFFKDFINLGLFHPEEEVKKEKKDYGLDIDDLTESENESEDDLLDIEYQYENSHIWTKTPNKEYHEYDDFCIEKSYRLKELLKMFKSWCKANGFGYSADKSCKSFSNKLFNLKMPLTKGTNSKNQTVVKFVPSDILLNLYNKKIVDIKTDLDWYTKTNTKKEIEAKKNGSAQIEINDLGLPSFD